jgi:small subunit ribosomal protein S6
MWANGGARQFCAKVATQHFLCLSFAFICDIKIKPSLSGSFNRIISTRMSAYVHREDLMRQYELVTVLNSEEEEFKSGKQAIVDLLSQYKAIDVKEEDMGDRPLSYPIKKKTRAHYVLYRMSFDPASIASLERAIKLNPLVLKHLVVKIEE